MGGKMQLSEVSMFSTDLGKIKERFYQYGGNSQKRFFFLPTYQFLNSISEI